MHSKSLTILFAKLMQPRLLVVAWALVFLIVAQQPLLAQVSRRSTAGLGPTSPYPGEAGSSLSLIIPNRQA